MARRRYISNSGRYYLPPGYYDADWSYYTPPGRSKKSRSGKSYRKNPMNWSGRARFGAVGGAFGAMVALDNWRMRGNYYKAYYKNTGKRPLYYNKLTRKRIKW